MQPNRIVGAGQQSLGSQRVQRALNNPNEPVACPHCGSIFFLEIIAQMYTTQQSGFRSLSQVPLKAYLCLCGALVKQPGLATSIQAGGERDWFAQSIDAALTRRAQIDPNALAQGFAGVQELEALRRRVDQLQEQLEAQGLVDETPVPEIPEPVNATTEPPPAPEPAVVVSRPRTEAAAVEGDVKVVVPTSRLAGATGGAKDRMKRQGK